MIEYDVIPAIVEKAIEKYQYLQKEIVWIECYNGIIVINWHHYMDGNINMECVKQIAKYIRKGTDKPIYTAIGKLEI